MENTPWYILSNADRVDSPALLVYPQRVKENIALAKSYVGETSQLRPHVKTHKMLEVIKMLQHEGINKFKCATIAEAEMLALASANEVLLAYQPVGPKIQRLLRLIKKFPGTKFSCLVDNIRTAEDIGSLSRAEHLQVSVFLDLNVGMNRTGVAPEMAYDLYVKCQNIVGIDVAGFHVYDGHIRDNSIEERTKRCDEAFDQVVKLANDVLRNGNRKPIIVAGGSPTFPIHAKRQEVECSPGTFIFWDWGYHLNLPDLKFQFAALVLTRVISKVDNRTLCLDLGHKSIAAENPLPRVKFLNYPDAIPVAQSEEHLVVKVEDASKFEPGDVFYGVPDHICPTCALYEQVYVVENNLFISNWRVFSRDKALTV